jgi:molybdopterin/thiamine biosynthesis adenylyltransferase
MDNSFFLRQLDIADPSQFKDKSITVIGAGGIGAATVVALAKTGFENITVYDFDTIEEHNLPNQLLPLYQDVPEYDPDTYSSYLDWESTIGQHKVNTLYNLTYRLAGVEIVPVPSRYVGQPLGEIVICAVDSLETRRQIWAQVRESMDTTFYLDGRMAITSMDLYAIDLMHDKAWILYERSLEGEASELPCTARATMFNSFIIAGQLVALLVAHLNGWKYPWRFYYNVRSFKTLPQYLGEK